MKEIKDRVIELLKKLKKLGVEFEPPDDGHGAYHVYHHGKTFSWAEGEDKPSLRPTQFVWIPEVDDCLEWLKERYGDINLGTIQGEWDVAVYEAHNRTDHPEFIEDKRGETPLEVLVLTILTVLDK